MLIVRFSRIFTFWGYTYFIYYACDFIFLHFIGLHRYREGLKEICSQNITDYQTDYKVFKTSRSGFVGVSISQRALELLFER